MTDFDKELDATGLSCPMPLLRLAKAVKGINSGEVLKMVATDPGSLEDVPSWVDKKGHELLDKSEDGGLYTFYIKKK